MAVVFDKEDLCDYIFGSAWADDIRITAISHQNLSCFINVLIPSITNHASENREFKYVLLRDFNEDDPCVRCAGVIHYYDAYPDMIYKAGSFDPIAKRERVLERYRAAFNSDVVPNALHEAYLSIEESLIKYFNMDSEEQFEYRKTLRKIK